MNQMIQNLKQRCKVLTAFVFLAVLSSFAGCDEAVYQDELSTSTENETADILSSLKTGALMKSYPFGLTGATIGDSAYLNSQYIEWKNNYVTPYYYTGRGEEFLPDGQLRVQRDVASHYDTVSEGMGYGLLLALYFDDKATFDGLFKYVKAHATAAGGLMHWKVDKYNRDVSEFYIPIPHSKAYLNRSTWSNEYDEERKYRTVDHAIKDFKIKASEVGNTDLWLPACTETRKASSATDGDLDIAAALVMASKKWNSDYYTNEAAKMVYLILKKDVQQDGTSRGFLKNGNVWGNSSCWNPSYFCPVWIKLFKSFIDKNGNNPEFKNEATTLSTLCTTTIDKMYEHMAIIFNNGVLPPDWADTSDGITVAHPTGSDRLYYIDDNRDGQIDDINGSKGMSFNHYYDAVRTGWRLAHDYSWTGDSRALSGVTEIGNFFKNQITTFVDGYDINGGAWSRGNRDLFNNFLPEKNGGQWHSTTFVAMESTSALSLGSASTALKFYKEVKSKNDPLTDRCHYYGNTTKLISLVYLAGYMVDLYN